MIEQETASIIKYVLDNSGNPAPYYYSVPQNFIVPAAYFPIPEITTRGETFRTFACEFAWFIKFFHNTTQEAYQRAYAALSAIKAARDLIPLIKQDGTLEGSGLWMRNPEVNQVDDGAVQLILRWISRRPYNDLKYLKMMKWYTNDDWLKSPQYQQPKLPDDIAEQI